METIILKDKFSKASENYDEASLIQREIAEEFFNRLELSSRHKNILDIGIGTGYLTERLKSKYPQLAVYGLDLALGMLCKTKNRLPQAKLTQADAKNLPFTNETFDIVISNLAYQWVGNLDYAFGEVKRVLKTKGKFYFTIFSENTLKELKETIREVLNNDVNYLKLQSIGNFPNKRIVETLLKNLGFKNIKIDLKTKQCFYSNLAELLSWLKLIGANQYWVDRFYRGLSARSFINNIANYYEDKFKDNGRIFATFETLFVESSKG